MILLKGCSIITRGGLAARDILIDHEKIRRVGQHLNSGPKSEIVECSGLIALPAFINCHIHMGYNPVRLMPERLGFDTFLARMGAEDRLIRSGLRDLKASVQKTIETSFRLGVFGFISQDIFFDMSAIAERTGAYILQCPTFYSGRSFRGDIERYEAYLDASRNRYSGMVRHGIGPHSLYALDTSGLEEISKLARKYELPVSMHFMERGDERGLVRRRHGCSPIEILKRNRLINRRLISIHNLFLDKDESGILRKAGASLVFCPGSNRRLHGRLPDLSGVRHYKKVGYGTDNPFFSLDVSSELRQACGGDLYILQEMIAKGYAVFGLDSGGSILAGKKAILQLADRKALAGEVPYIAEHLIVDGRFVVKNRKLSSAEP
jgi:5-methylthioadenosine/S-adenosylhomocysteine deaminase